MKITSLEQKVDAFCKKIIKIEKELKNLKLTEEKQNRSAFIDEIENILNGAAVEYFKCKINDNLELHHQDRQHWENEWREHLGPRLLVQLERTTTFSNKEKAIEEAFRSCIDSLSAKIKAAASKMGSYLNANPSDMSKSITTVDMQDFYNIAKQSISDILEGKIPVTKAPDWPWNNKSKKKKVK